MMSLILATADFPDIAMHEFAAITARLERENWIKMHDHSRLTATIWFFPSAPDEPQEALRFARHSFTSCCIPYCIPRIALEWGANEDTFTPQLSAHC